MPIATTNSLSKDSFNIAFVHADLGVGGAERLIVDAAKSLQDRGHSVTVYTSHYDPKRCFEETRGIPIAYKLLIEITSICILDLKVVVKGDWIPRHIAGLLHLVFAALRNLYLSLWIYLFSAIQYDVIIVDQISYSVPILKRCADKVLFYCHYPDALLAPKSRNPLRTLLYRGLLDYAEERTMLQADKIVANSEFTANVFLRHFKNAKDKPDILYPAVDESKFAVVPLNHGIDLEFPWPALNRFERKKNIKLAIESISWLRRNLDGSITKDLILVIAGGYDLRLRENVDHHRELQELCDENNLKHVTVWPHQEPSDVDPNESDMATVFFMPSISDSRRNALLAKTFCLLYTPANEHFGIVPLEGMAMGIPVIGMNSGGPKETIIDGVTGFLCEPTPSSVGSRVKLLLGGKASLHVMSQKAKEHIRRNFSMRHFGDQLENIILDLVPYEEDSRFEKDEL